MSGLGDYILKALKTTHLTREAAPGLYDAMENVATDLKMPMPKFHLIPEKFFNHPLLDSLAHSANAASISRTDIILNHPILKLFESADLSQPISQELKAILAHEMHHCANRGKFMAMTRLPLFAFPAIAVAATYIYDRAHAKAKKDRDTSAENISTHIDSATEETKKSLLPEAQHSDFLNQILHWGKYFAAAAVGVGAGLMAVRYGSRYHEFAADVFGAKSVINKESMISALRKLHEASGQSVSEHPQAEKFKGIIAETILAHPSFAERAANIRSRG